MNGQEPALALDAWLEGRDEQLSDARKQGVADRANGIPPAEGESAHPKRTRVVNDVADLFQRYREGVLGQLSERLQRLDRDYQSQEIKLKADLGFEEDEDPGRQPEQLTDDLSTGMCQAREELARFNKQEQAPKGYGFRLYYIGLMAFFALAELNVNRTAFELFFPPSTSLLTSLIVGVGLLLGAHWAGLWIRQCTHESRWRWRWSYMGRIAGVFVFQAVVVLLLAACRHAYILFRRDAASGVSADDILQQASAGELAQQAFSFDFGIEGWTLLVVNLFMVAIGTVASTIRHDPVQEHEHCWRRWSKLKRKDQKRREEWSKSRSRGQMAELLDKTREVRDKLNDEDESLLVKARSAARRVVEVVEAYEYANIEDVSGPRPSCFFTVSDERMQELEEDVLATLLDIVGSPEPAAELNE